MTKKEKKPAEKKAMSEQATINICSKEVTEILQKHGCGIRVNHAPELFIIKEK